MGCLTNPVLLLFTPVAGLLWLVWAIVFAAGIFLAGIVMFVPWALSAAAREGKSDVHARRTVGVT